MRALVAALLIALALPAAAEERARTWTRTDTVFQLVFTGLTLADLFQTHWIADHSRDHVERNPILGPYPSHARVNALIGAAIVAHLGVSLLLPQPYRRVWQSVWIGVEAEAVWHNYRVGIGFSW